MGDEFGYAKLMSQTIPLVQITEALKCLDIEFLQKTSEEYKKELSQFETLPIIQGIRNISNNELKLMLLENAQLEDIINLAKRLQEIKSCQGQVALEKQRN